MCQGRKRIASTVPALFKKVLVVLTLWKMSKPDFVNDLPDTDCWNSAVKRWEHKLASSTQVQILDASFLRGFTGNVTLSKLHILSESVPSSTKKQCSLSYKFPKCTCNYYYHTVCPWGAWNRGFYELYRHVFPKSWVGLYLYLDSESILICLYIWKPV